MNILWNYLLITTMVAFVHSGESESTEHDSKDCQDEGCNHNNQIYNRKKRENEYGSNRRICSPNKKWKENTESCICSSDGLRIYCAPTGNEVKLRRKRTVGNKHCDCRNDDDTGSETNGNRCCSPTVHNSGNFCNCMSNFFFNCMCRSFQNMCCCFAQCCNGNRRKNLRAQSCCDNCCEGMCGSSPDWKCHCTHDKNPANRPSQSETGRQSSDGKTIDLNKFLEFCKKHSTSKTGNDAKIALDTVLEFCKRQTNKDCGEVSKHCNQENQQYQTKEQKKEAEEGLKSIFEYMEACNKNSKEESEKPKPAQQNTAHKEISGKDRKEGLKQIFKYMKTYIDDEKERNIKKRAQSSKPSAPAQENKNRNKRSKQKLKESEKKMSHREESNINNPNNKAYRGNKIQQGHFKGKTVVQHLDPDSSGVGDIVTVESNEMVYINM